MKTPHLNFPSLVAPGLAVLLVAACSGPMTKPEGAANTRNKLSQLQADPELANRAPLAMKDAETAVRAAEVPQDDVALGRHLVVMADRKVDIARNQAQTRLYEDQRKALAEQRQAALLASRTLEADRARNEARMARGEARDARSDARVAQSTAEQAKMNAEMARNETEMARTQAEAARSETEAARIKAETARSESVAARQASALAQQQSEELQRRLTEMDAKTTERGLVVTLGDILFESGKSTLRVRGAGHLGKLASFLKEYKDRNVLIEGHTDAVGSEESNQSLSQRRAETVKAYLVNQGVSDSRLTATGKGEGAPIADNESATGRQQNRRVEVIIENTSTAAK